MQAFSTSAKRSDDRKQLSSGRSCVECRKKASQVQCLHCAKNVCLECAQKHADLVANENHGIMDLLNEKVDALDRIAAKTRQKIAEKREKMIEAIEVECDRTMVLLSKLVDDEKKQLRRRNEQLGEMSFNEIPMFVRNLRTELEAITDANDHFFNISSTMPQIVLKRQHRQTQNTNSNVIVQRNNQAISSNNYQSKQIRAVSSDSDDDELFR